MHMYCSPAMPWTTGSTIIVFAEVDESQIDRSIFWLVGRLVDGLITLFGVPGEHTLKPQANAVVPSSVGMTIVGYE